MANLALILGASGHGKSSSIRTLDPGKTVVFNTVGKQLPIKGGNSLYNKELKNRFDKLNYTQLIKGLEAVNSNPDYSHIEYVILDDIIYMMRADFLDRIQDKGFDKYNALVDNFQKTINKCLSMRDNLSVFMMFHPEAVESDGSIVTYKVATVGKLLDKMFNPLEQVTVTLYAKIRYTEGGTPEYGFYTNATKVEGIEIPAKTPMGMFTELFIPNDLKLVADKMKEYYG